MGTATPAEKPQKQDAGHEKRTVSKTPGKAPPATAPASNVRPKTNDAPAEALSAETTHKILKELNVMQKDTAHLIHESHRADAELPSRRDDSALEKEAGQPK